MKNTTKNNMRDWSKDKLLKQSKINNKKKQ